MKEVVVVDDERLVLLGIKSYVMLAEDRYRVTGAFTSAKEALIFCRDHPPNILLTDIKMPVVDGLQLIRQVKTELPDTKIIVLSCHDDYAYVHEAFRLGAADYVLKDQVEEEELVSILDAVAYKGREPLPLAGGQSPSYSWPRLLESLRAGETRDTRWYVATIGFKNAYDSELSPIPWDFDSHVLIQSIRDTLGRGDTAYASEYHGNQIACILRARQHLAPEGERSRAEHIIRETCAEISKYWNRTVVASMKREPVTTKLLDDAMEEAAALRAYAFYDDRGGLLDSTRLGPGSMDVPAPATPRFSLSGIDHESAWLDEIEGFFKTLISGGSSVPPHPREVKAALTKGLMILSNEIRECLGLQLEEVGITEGNLLRAISDIDNIQVLRRYLRTLLQRIAAAIDSERTGSSLVGRARARLRENHSRKTSLASTASYLNVSPAYLSHRFRVETGRTFSQWLNEARIDHATKLLSTTDWPVKKIAFEVGYDSASYFSRVFNSLSGRYPSDYRRVDSSHQRASNDS